MSIIHSGSGNKQDSEKESASLDSLDSNAGPSDLDLSRSTLSTDEDEPYQLEIAGMQNEDGINLDDALDDDNDNPVSQTLVVAVENSGPEEIRDTQELEGEEQESRDRTGSLSPLYKET